MESQAYLVALLHTCYGWRVLKVDPSVRLSDNHGTYYYDESFIPFEQTDGMGRRWTPQLTVTPNAKDGMEVALTIDYGGALARVPGQPKVEGSVAFKLGKVDATPINSANAFKPLYAAAARYERSSAEFYLDNNNRGELSNTISRTVTVLDNGYTYQTTDVDTVIRILSQSGNTERERLEKAFIVFELNMMRSNFMSLDAVSLGAGAGWAPCIWYGNLEILTQETAVQHFIDLVAYAYDEAYHANDFGAISDLWYALDMIERSRD